MISTTPPDGMRTSVHPRTTCALVRTWPRALTRKPEPVDFRFENERRRVRFRRGLLSGSDEGSQHRGLQPLGYLAGDWQPGVGLERPDGGPGPCAEDAVDRSGVVAQPAQRMLKIGDAVSGALRPGLGRTRGRGGRGRWTRSLDRRLCRRHPGSPLPSQALCPSPTSAARPRFCQISVRSYTQIFIFVATSFYISL